MKNIASREDFIETFNNYIKDDTSSSFHYTFDILVEDYKSGKQAGRNYLQAFLHAQDIHPIVVDNIMKDIVIKSEFDSYYEEDEDNTGEFCRFNCKVNIDQLYDLYIIHSNFNLHTKQIYRIESRENDGLYSGVFAKLDVDEHLHPAPFKDPAFKRIFSEPGRVQDEPYQDNWYFAFSNLQDLKSWTINDDNIKQLHDHGYIIKKITLPENFMIEGNKQTIFQKKYVVYEETLNFTTLLPNKSLSM